MKTIKQAIMLAFSVLLFACGNNNDNYDASGTFEATEIVVASEATGKILAFDVQEGDVLQANQPVGYIDSTQLYLRKKQLLKSVNVIESRRPETQKQIAVIEQQIATQRNEKRRVETLLQANAANQKQLDDINAQIALLERQLTAQRSSLSITSRGITEEAAATEVQIEQLNDQLQKCQIINPINGTVLVKYTEADELAVPGKSLYKIADVDNMILRAYVTSDQLTQLKIGQDVQVFADFGKDVREYAGRINWISSKSEFTPKTIQTRDERANLVYAVKISVKNDDYLKIGMYGQVRFNSK